MDKSRLEFVFIDPFNGSLLNINNGEPIRSKDMSHPTIRSIYKNIANTTFSQGLRVFYSLQDKLYFQRDKVSGIIALDLDETLEFVFRKFKRDSSQRKKTKYILYNHNSEI
jgi:hypothetical protein